MKNLIVALADLLDIRSVLSGDANEARYQADWSGENARTLPLVLRPADSAALATALAYCNRHSLAVVTQGSMTGLSGGAIW